MSDDLNRQLFKEEAYDLLGELESSLLELEGDPGDEDLVNKVFRALHTIKGSGSMFGFEDIAEFTHEVETVFDQVRSGELVLNTALITCAFQARDHIQNLLDTADEEAPAADGADILERLRAAAAGEPAEPEPDADAEDTAGLEPIDAEPATDGAEEAAAGPEAEPPAADEAAEPGEGPVAWRIHLAPKTPEAPPNLDMEPLFTELAKLGPCRVAVDVAGAPDLEDMDPAGLYLGWDVYLTTDQGRAAIEDVFLFSDVDWDLDIRPGEDPGEPEAPEPVPAPAPQDEAEPDWDQEDEEPRKLGEILVESGDASAEDVEAALQSQKPIGAILEESGRVPKEKIDRAVEAQEAERAKRRQRQQTEAVSSIRVAAEKLDYLVDLVGELVIVQAQISQVVGQKGDQQLTGLAEELERLSDELRDSTLGIRMLPIGTTFSKFRRLVRDLSSELGKEINLSTKGAETELDKTVIERLGDPLVHLLRNSIDHGIETPDERRAAGKNPAGSILLAAEHSGGEVLIRITDDGRGLDAERILAKAREKGLVAAEADLSDSEVYNLIFHPGFSTAQQVTNVSGRGVGMDVVKRAIDGLRGRIQIDSKPGKGTSITVRLPLTLAIIDGLQILVGREYYVIPLSLVEECVELAATDAEKTKDGKSIINLRGEIVPYIHLRDWFEVPGEPPAIEQIVICGVQGSRIGIVVDHVIGEHQTVIKSLGKVYRDVEGISGATIKGDGTMALILDVIKLVHSVVEAG